MKIIHTSDWHLGKKLYKKDRLPEQKLFLDWLMCEVEAQSAEILVISGDIFDTPMPPTDALSLFFNFLKSLEDISFLKGKSLKKVVIIGGNHDGSKLLEAPRPFLENNLVTILGRPKPASGNSESEIRTWKNQNSLTVDDKIFIGMLPYFRVSDFIDSPFRDQIENYNDLQPQEQIISQLKVWSDNLLKNQTLPSIMLGHHLFGSFMPGGSEQGVSLSGLDTIPLSLFNEWDVLMLGHIHKAQVLKKEGPTAIYCGSPLPMRFSESNEKSIFLYNIKSKNDIEYTNLPIPIFRPLIKIESTPEKWMEQLLFAIKKWSPCENPLSAYIEMSISFDKFQPNYVDYVRSEINDLPVELLNFFGLFKEQNEEIELLKADTVRNSTIEELFDIYLDSCSVDTVERPALTKTFKEVLRGNSDL